MHIVVSIVVAFLIIGAILALLEIKAIRNAVIVILGFVLVIGVIVLMVTVAAGIGYLLFWPLVQELIHDLQQMGRPSLSPSWQAIYVMVSFFVAAIAVLVVGTRRSKGKMTDAQRGKGA